MSHSILIYVLFLGVLFIIILAYFKRYYEDKNNILDSGAIGLIVEDGTLVTDEIVVG